MGLKKNSVRKRFIPNKVFAYMVSENLWKYSADGWCKGIKGKHFTYLKENELELQRTFIYKHQLYIVDLEKYRPGMGGMSEGSPETYDIARYRL